MGLFPNPVQRYYFFFIYANNIAYFYIFFAFFYTHPRCNHAMTIPETTPRPTPNQRKTDPDHAMTDLTMRGVNPCGAHYPIGAPHLYFTM